MKKNKGILRFFSILGIVIIVGVAAFGYAFLREPEAPSVGLEEPSVMPATEVTQTSEGQPTAESAPEENISEENSQSSIFRIDSSQSEARFTLNEVLEGQPTVVIGKTRQVTGEFRVEPDQSQVEVGEILVNARDLATDNTFRNRAIHNRILDSNTFEFISFRPTDIILLPDEVNIGEEIVFEIAGALTIKGVTQQVIFMAKITPISEMQIEGHAETMLAYADYGIKIPSVERVAEVDEEVLLEIDFVALAVSE